VVPPNLLKVKADADKNRARLGSLACFSHDFEWGAGADRPSVPLEDTVVLEIHVPTFTAGLASPAA
jgi:pullulanase/glycogen debranching enzyme